MRKRQLHYLWHKVSNVSLWVLVGLFAFFSLLSVYALRQNNLTMVRLREAVYVADKQGGDVETALRKLRAHVYAHMNTNLKVDPNSTEPPIQLAETYNRLVAAEQARVAALGGNNAVYVAGQKKCESAFVPLSQRVSCIQQYVSENGGAQYQLNLPQKEFYTFDFVSPRWSPDVAGISMVIAGFMGILLLVRLIAGRAITKYLAE